MGKTKTVSERKEDRVAKRLLQLKKKEQKGLARIKKIVKCQQELVGNMMTASELNLVNNYKVRSAPCAEPMDTDLLDMYSKEYNSDPINMATQNALASVPISWLSEDRQYLKGLDYAYSNLLDFCPQATSQAHSGRCWLFAALNTMRQILIKNHRLNDRFELSEAYLFFYDKIERAMFFLEKVLETRDRPNTDIIVNGMFTSFNPVSDGGTWQFFTNLILKYGIVPKSCYGETFNTSCTDEMNDILYRKLAEYAHFIRESELQDNTLQKRIKEEFMPEIYALMAKFMGEPPRNFNWSYHEVGDSFESVRERGPHQCIENLTPRLFYESLIEPFYKIANKVVLRHDPRQSSEYYRTYAVDHFGHMVGAKPDISLNVPWEVLSLAASTSILAGKAVWFAADVCKEMNDGMGILSTEGFDYNSVLNTTLNIDKAQSLDTFTSTPSHAMALVGVDLVNGDPTQVKKWKVENSWGESYGDDPGYFLMTQAWFEKYGYEVVVDLDTLDEKVQEAYLQYEFNPIRLPYNDPFGAVARTCQMCKSKAFKPLKR
jgi:bleomycin hydrolase